MAARQSPSVSPSPSLPQPTNPMNLSQLLNTPSKRCPDAPPGAAAQKARHTARPGPHPLSQPPPTLQMSDHKNASLLRPGDVARPAAANTTKTDRDHHLAGPGPARRALQKPADTRTQFSKDAPTPSAHDKMASHGGLVTPVSRSLGSPQDENWTFPPPAMPQPQPVPTQGLEPQPAPGPPRQNPDPIHTPSKQRGPHHTDAAAAPKADTDTAASPSATDKLRSAASLDLRRSTLARRVPFMTWDQIKAAALHLHLPSHWTELELRLIIRQWASPVEGGLAFIEEECFTRSASDIAQLMASLDKHYGPIREQLSLHEIFAFEICHNYTDFLAPRVQELLPQHLIERIRELIATRFPYKPRWTAKELEVIGNAVAQGTPPGQLLNALPFRPFLTIKLKYTEEQKRSLIQLTPQPKRKRAESATTPKRRTLALLTRAKRYKPVEQPQASKKYQKFISDILSNVLTASGIAEACDNEYDYDSVVEDIRQEIKDRGGSTCFPFTSAENAVIRKCVKKEITRKECDAELIMREKDEIDHKIDKMEYVLVRKKNFKSHIDRLIYEAQWYSSMSDDYLRRGRTRSGNLLDNEGSNSPASRRSRVTRASVGGRSESSTNLITPTKAKREPVNSDKLDSSAGTKRKNLRTPRVAKLDTKPATKRPLKPGDRRRKENRPPKISNPLSPLSERPSKSKTPTTLASRTRSKAGRKKRKTQYSDLLYEAKYFQSITGDGSDVEEGKKRKRKQACHFIPEFEDRQKLKKAQQKLLALQKKDLMTPDTEDGYSDSEEIEKLKAEVDSDSSTGLMDISPFDPTSIIDDTLIDIGGRQLFNEATAQESLFPAKIQFSPDINVLLKPVPEVPINNTKAAQIIREHYKGYKSLPDTFPPFLLPNFMGKETINHRNIVHIRYLLYPQHTEQFILAQPKTNQLDPINEIKKVFQIHYALYFSFSEELRTIIDKDYCERLLNAVRNNNFSEFMRVIDGWNSLMLELTPYPIEIDPAIDINESLRDYLPRIHSVFPTLKQLQLHTFYAEIINSEAKIKRNSKGIEAKAVERKLSATLGLPNILNSFQNVVPEVFVSRFRHLRPMTYSRLFMKLLAQKDTLSRFCVHQLILRTYTRIVSPESRKLRSYKAFSAEVYGELLPSFVSEVLTKIDLQPHHKFYDLGCGVGNTTFQAALEYGVQKSGGCEIMPHASELTALQEIFMRKQLQVFGLKPLNLSFALNQSFVNNPAVRKECLDCDVILVNNYLFEYPLNYEIGKLLYGLRPGTIIISLRNFLPPRYKPSKEKTIFDYLKVEKYEMSDFFSVSWTANKVPYYISTVQREIQRF